MSEQTIPSPFHSGELAVQERMGVRDRVAIFGERMFRPVLIDQHRDFYSDLPFVALGSVDNAGRPWASVVAGEPGFLKTPDNQTLDVSAIPLPGDPLAQNLKLGADIGVLGMGLETRRRNRMSGRVESLRGDGFSLSVLQSFGNCPKYIQSRNVSFDHDVAPSLTVSDRLDYDATGIINRADTIFIATSFRDQGNAKNQGADVSHRGGKPGFIKVLDDRRFLFPDFSGNNIFNTIGNLTLNPLAGILVPDFGSRSLISLTGKAEIIWGGPQVAAFEGAHRLIHFHVDEARNFAGGLALKTEFLSYERHLEQTGP